MASLTRHLWFDALPAIHPPEVDVVGFHQRIERYARRSGDVRISFGSFGGPGIGSGLSDLGYALRPRYEFELDLSKAEEALWRGMEHKRRKNVQKARRAGVVVEPMPPDAGKTELFRLHRLTKERLASKGVDAQAGSDDEVARERSLIADGTGQVVGARLGSEWIAASLFTVFNGQVYHVLSGHSDRALDVQAPTCLLWETILRTRAEGATRFNLGGVSADAVEPSAAEHGVMRYKDGFGGERLHCLGGTRTLRPAKALMATSIRKLFRR